MPTVYVWYAKFFLRLLTLLVSISILLLLAPRSARSFYDRNAMETSRSAIGTTTAAGFPVMSPQEDVLAVNGSCSGQYDSKCIICLEKPRDATIVHGGTGHVCCCLDCAKRLEQRRDPCPICKQPIQLVIQQFVS